jgi:hypothetical protein
MTGAALTHGGTPPWVAPPADFWDDLAADREAAALFGIPLADDDDLAPRAACVPPAAIPLRRPAHLPRRPARHATSTRPDPRKENTRAA